MENDLLLTARIGDHKELCISPISRKTFEECAADFFPSDRGFFIFERDRRDTGAGFAILGKASSLDAAFRIFELLSLAAVPVEVA